MMSSEKTYYRYSVAALALVALNLIGAGCGARPNLPKAEDVVKISLEKWKEGATPGQLVEQGIEIADPDWAAGDRLIDYEIKAVSAQPQQGPRVVAVLQLQKRAGKKATEEVAYEVILAEKIRIGRDAFHVVGP